MFTIRPEQAGDENAIRALTILAFESSPYGYHGEADLIDAAREDYSACFSLVATAADGLAGHALFTPAEIRAGNQTIAGMGLAPISVTPQFQRQGIGSALIQQGLQQAFDSGRQFVIVLGEPAYYQRFGFRPAAESSIKHGFEGIGQEYFFVVWNPQIENAAVADGLAYYLPLFGLQHAAV